MANLIIRLRGMSNAGTADYTIAGETYWTDEKLQETLDRFRADLNRVPLRAEPEYSAGELVYHDYYAPVGDFEEVSTGPIAWAVEDSVGNVIGTATYSPDYVRGMVRFTTDQAGTAYYLRARAFDLNRAAAQVWRLKAAHYAERYDVQSDNHRLTRSQLIKQCLEMAASYDSMAGAQSVRMQRDDLA